MLILGVQPKRICVTVEFDLVELGDILDLLDKMTIDYNKEEEPETHRKMEFLKKVFIPTMDRLVEQYKDGT